MEGRQDLDRWADALLDQHRTGPRGPAEHEDPIAIEDLPLGLRLFADRDGPTPDRHMLERYRRNAERHQRFVRAEAIVTIVGVSILAVLAYALLSGF